MTRTTATVGDQFGSGNWWDAIAGPFGQVMPETLFVGMVCSMIIVAIWLNSRSIVLVAVTTMLSGGVVVEFLPARVRTAGYLLIVFGVAAAMSAVYLGRDPRSPTR